MGSKVVPFNASTAEKLDAQPGQLPALLSVQEVADYLGVGTSTVRDMVARGELPAYKVRRRVRIAAADVLAYLESTKEVR